MKVIGKNKLNDFGKQQDVAVRKGLAAWLKIVEQANWKHFMDVKRVVPKASGGVKGSFTVFDICGNRFRLVTIGDYEIQTVLIKDFLTHAEYDRWNNS